MSVRLSGALHKLVRKIWWESVNIFNAGMWSSSGCVTTATPKSKHSQFVSTRSPPANPTKLHWVYTSKQMDGWKISGEDLSEKCSPLTQLPHLLNSTPVLQPDALPFQQLSLSFLSCTSSDRKTTTQSRDVKSDNGKASQRQRKCTKTENKSSLAECRLFRIRHWS